MRKLNIGRNILIINFFKNRRSPIFSSSKMEDDLNFYKKWRWPQCFQNGRLPQFFSKMEEELNFSKMGDNLNCVENWKRWLSFLAFLLREQLFKHGWMISVANFKKSMPPSVAHLGLNPVCKIKRLSFTTPVRELY